MEQLGLPMLTLYKGPQLVDRLTVVACKTYREAVRECWELGRVKRPGYTKRQLAEDIGCYASHVSDYLAKDDDPKRRDLPAKRIDAFELQMGNRLVSQWLALQSGLPVIDAGFLDHLAGMRRVA